MIVISRLELQHSNFAANSNGNVPNSDIGQRGSTFVIVLWIAFGLVSMALYFGSSMSSELRASDNRVSGVAAEQAIEGAARYVNYVLANQPTNGVLPDLTTYVTQAGRIGDAYYWLIGR